ncbi:MAG TPA: thioredoxin domain-containing protein, partial [Anaerolineales bacterium]|nr:thioredoxin domain-containing protein [Anaerolineales bacterium]
MTNALAAETSPYLRQHAENPVAWLPWSAAALQRARDEDKPIFLSIGYAACHWCHVMAHESFEDEAVAAQINRDFVAIKVDREERPDVDAVYMEAVVALTGQGGWPLSVFLTPDGQPFFGGTYFPPQSRHGLPSFSDVLRAVQAAWKGDRSQLLETSKRLAEHLAQGARMGEAAPAIDGEAEGAALEALLRGYDWEHGGWGGAPKFPQPSVIGLLLRRFDRSGDRLALDMALHALEAMARGGIFDQIGGGFHRYAVDRTWTVPHFEKMLYDNALLARVYLEAWLVTRRPLHLETARATLEFMRNELGTPEGGFGASLDADSEGEEGRYYLWSAEEVTAALGAPETMEAFRRAFDCPAQGHIEGRLVLRRPGSVAVPTEDTNESIDEVRRKLLEARGRRVRPACDDKVITAWNGLALSAWSMAARCLGRAQDLTTAQRLADFLLTALRPEGRLLRTYRLGQARHPGCLDDHAALAEGLLDLYQVDCDGRWLEACLSLAETIRRDFADPTGGFFDTAEQPQGLPARPKSLQDTPVPSGNALAVSVFLRLAALTGESRFTQAALAPLQAMQSTAVRYPTAFAGWLQGLALAAAPMPQLAIAGQVGSAAFTSLLREAHGKFLPRLVIAGGLPEDAGAPVLLRGKSAKPGRATAYLCTEFVCRQPTDSPQ